MLKITLLFAEKKLNPTVLDGLNEYKKRLSKSCQLDWKTDSKESAIQTENPTLYNIRLDREGQTMTSSELANQIQAWMTSGISQLVILVGEESIHFPNFGIRPTGRSPFGGPKFGTFSLSPAALSQNTAGLLMAEQIYRAFRIIEGKAYHK